MSELVSEQDLVRARQDPVFRQRFYADQLDRLLGALNRMRKSSDPTAEQSRQIKEGVDLAVKLADRLNTRAKASGNAAA
jgi:hypothetical protein